MYRTVNFPIVYSLMKMFLSVFQSDVLSISMDRGAVVLNASGIKIQSPDKNYNDGKTHFIITSVTPER